MKLEAVDVEYPKDSNVIVGQAHFIKTVEDLYEAIVGSVPGVKFGLAFCEASGKRLIRHEGNDEELRNAAIQLCKKIAAGHVFSIFIRNAYPINVLNAIKNVQEVVTIFAATANPLTIIVAEQSPERRGVVGVIDGAAPLGVEGSDDESERKELLRRFGYKR
ncbi:adenosine monophosphate-protein transferase [Thermocladium modestius]|uniref:Adenosine monophosphate-protein transferase n=1 Tax=Thermocladium modestius TaxID=62609 RepID=A0A830GYN4_9CREN|nr:adenosine-specific kinase [Thermocladium modestius]GGP22594.1 adenosine monophosphate-protein transferase [Thermocladium modestius]